MDGISRKLPVRETPGHYRRRRAIRDHPGEVCHGEQHRLDRAI
jgi:hypothetical protein